MAKAVLAGMLMLGLAACTGGAPKVARDGAPPEQLLAGGTRVTATIQDSLSSRTNKTGDTLHAIVSGDPVSAELDPVPHHLQVRTISKSAPHRLIETRGVEAFAATWSSRPAPRSYLRSRIH